MKLLQGDCLELMGDIPEGSVDMVLADPPYGTTACKWDSIIPLDPMWEYLRQVIKPNGAIVMTASQPFTTTLIASNMAMFKYCWVWDKKIPSGMAYCRYQPMRQHEDVIVFCSGRTVYNAQVTMRDKPIKAGGNSQSKINNKGIEKPLKKVYKTKQPTTIISFMKIRQQALHPTQKPVALMEYLIRTYTNEGETVLDFTMGSGTTGVACKNLGREFIGIELDPEYYRIACERIADTPTPLFTETRKEHESTQRS
jgi:site-specific DNA-methyltransferase (adenine-specific)